MLPFLSLLPILLYLLVLRSLDSFALAKWSLLGICTGVGILSCLLALAHARLLGIQCIPYNVAIEEILKGCFMVYLVLSKRIRFLAETLIYGAAVGGGFAVLENIIYLYYNPDMYVGTAIFRGFGVAIMHMGCTGLVASLALLTLDRKPRVLYLVLSFIPSFLIHFVHNTVQFEPLLQLTLFILVFFFMFLLIFHVDEKRIYKWMDHSISVDIETLSSIKQGNFSTTKAGLYLLSVKEQFHPEVFFDIICYVEIYYEMVIEKQSLMLMQQAGFKDELSPEEQAARSAKEKEFKELRKRIGKSGNWILRPIIR